MSSQILDVPGYFRFRHEDPEAAETLVEWAKAHAGVPLIHEIERRDDNTLITAFTDPPRINETGDSAVMIEKIVAEPPPVWPSFLG